MFCNDKNCTHRLCEHHWVNAKKEGLKKLVYLQDKNFCKKRKENKNAKKSKNSKKRIY